MREWRDEAYRQARSMLRRARFSVVCQIGDDLYYKHRDGRRLILKREESGEPKVVRLDT